MKVLDKRGLEQIQAPEEWIREVFASNADLRDQRPRRRFRFRTAFCVIGLVVLLAGGTIAVAAKHPALSGFRSYLGEIFSAGADPKKEEANAVRIKKINFPEDISLGQYKEGYFITGKENDEIYEWKEGELQKCPLSTWRGSVGAGGKEIQVSFDYVMEQERFYACHLGGNAVSVIGCRDGSGEVYLGVKVADHEFRTYLVHPQKGGIVPVLPHEKYALPFAVSPEGKKILFLRKEYPAKKKEVEKYYLYDRETGDFWDTEMPSFLTEQDIELTEHVIYIANDDNGNPIQYDIASRKCISYEWDLEGYDMYGPVVAVENTARWEDGVCSVVDIAAQKSYEVDVSGFGGSSASVSVGVGDGKVYFFTDEGPHIFIMEKNILLDLSREEFSGVDYLGMVYALSDEKYLVTAVEVEGEEKEYRYHYFMVDCSAAEG